MLLRTLPALLAASFLAATASCDDHGTTTDPCGEPEYGGAATDEAFTSIVDGEKRVSADDTKSVAITVPTQSQVFQRSAPPLLRWMPGSVSSSMSRLHVPASRRFATRVPTREKSPFAWVARLFESEAWAHEPPITGPLFYLHFTVPGRACEVRVLTTMTSYQVSTAAFDAFKAATGPITLSITSAYVRENRITEGPYKPTAARTFTVAP